MCPPCIPAAGCRHIGCSCYFLNILLEPLRNLPNWPRSPNCPDCQTICPVSFVKCPVNNECKGDEVGYVIAPIQIPKTY